MALNVRDPNLKMLWGLDESSANSTRVNAASGNSISDFDLVPQVSTGSEGVPAVNDEKGGKAANVEIDPPNFVVAQRWLQSKADKTLQTFVDDGDILNVGDFTQAGDSVVFGIRFNWPDLQTGVGGGVDNHYLMDLQHATIVDATFALMIRPDSNVSPATGGEFDLDWATVGEKIDTTWATTGSPGSEYITSQAFGRVALRCRWKSAGVVTIKCFYFDEEADATYTFEKDFTTAQLNFDAAQLARVFSFNLGCRFASSGKVSQYGAVDEAWYYTADLTDAEIDDIIKEGIQIPYVDEVFAIEPHDVRVAVANESNAFPIPRLLPIGGPQPAHVVGVHAQRVRLFYEGFRAGRPYSIRRIDTKHDTVGPWNRGRRGNTHTYDDFSTGLILEPGLLPDGASVAGFDMDISGPGIRRRKGYRIRTRVSDLGDVDVNSFYSWRNVLDQLFWLHKVGDTLYVDTGGDATSLGSTGWNSAEHIVAEYLDDRLIICQRGGKNAVWDGSSATYNLGEPAPDGGSLSLTIGTLTGTYAYAYTFTDPVTGDETAPFVIPGSIVVNVQGVLISGMDTTPVDPRFTTQKIYRTVSEGAAPDLFFIASQLNAATFTDADNVDGTEKIDVVVDSGGGLVNYITGEAPAAFWGCFLHKQRMFYWAGRDLYWSEPNEPMRFDPGAFLRFPSNIISGISQDYQILIWSRNQTHIVESDFLRDGDGDYDIRQNLTDEQVGIIGPLARTTRNEEVWWLDRRGVYSMSGDKPILRSGDVDNLFRGMNTGLGEAFTVAYNHIQDTIWFGTAMANRQNDTESVETVLVMFPKQSARYKLFRTQAVHITQYDDDLNGIRFGATDHLGNWKEYESFEGDGQESSESAIWEADDGISSVAGSLVTVKTTDPSWVDWVEDEHRGKSVILRDVETGFKNYYLILRNGTNTLTMSHGAPEFGADDGYYIGGMFGDVEFAEQEYGTPNEKVVRDMKTEFDILTTGRFD